MNEVEDHVVDAVDKMLSAPLDSAAELAETACLKK